MQLFTNVFYRLPELETPQLLLRGVKLSDAQDLYEYSKDEEVAKHVLWTAHKSIQETKAYIRYLLRQYRNGQPSSYCITLKESGKVIGTIGFMWVNKDNLSAEVGYSLSRDYWNKGYMTQALSAILRFGFETLGLNRIEAQHEVDNPASGKVMSHVGMQFEGILRSRLYNKNRFVDVALYSILRSDWAKKTNN